MHNPADEEAPGDSGGKPGGAVRRDAHEPPSALDLRLPAALGSLTVLRLELGLWLFRLAADAATEIALQHAVGELAANVIEHAYRREAPSDPAARWFTVRGRVVGEREVEIVVRDNGAWKEPEPEGAERGNGLVVASGAVDELTVEHDGSGTRARIRHRLVPREPDAPAG